MNRTNTARSPTTNVGTPNIECRLTASVCSSASIFSGRPARDFRRDRVGVEADRRRDLAQHLGLGDLAALVVAGRERGDVPVEELVGERVADGDAPTAARSRRCPTRRDRVPRPGARPLRRAPGRARTAGTRRPSRGRRAVRQSPTRARCGRRGTGSRSSRRTVGPRRPPVIGLASRRTQPDQHGAHSPPSPMAARRDGPSARPNAAPATTSDAWCSRTYTRVADTAAAAAYQAGPPPSSVAAQNAAVAWPDGNELVIGRRRPWRNSMSA